MGRLSQRVALRIHGAVTGIRMANAVQLPQYASLRTLNDLRRCGQCIKRQSCLDLDGLFAQSKILDLSTELIR